jgi:hypothetical protein
MPRLWRRKAFSQCDCHERPLPRLWSQVRPCPRLLAWLDLFQLRRHSCAGSRDLFLVVSDQYPHRAAIALAAHLVQPDIPALVFSLCQSLVDRLRRAMGSLAERRGTSVVVILPDRISRLNRHARIASTGLASTGPAGLSRGESRDKRPRRKCPQGRMASPS